MYDRQTYPDPQSPDRVLLILDLTASMCRRILMGVARYARVHTRWSLAPESMDSAYTNLAKQAGNYIGMIGMLRVSDAPDLEVVRASGLPAVNVSNNAPPGDFPAVLNDDAEVGRMAAAHLLERGFQHFAFASVGNFQFNVERLAGYREMLAGSRREVISVHSGSDRRGIARWLRDLPKPLAVFCASDLTSRHVSEACRLANLQVPHDVAILGVNNDELICDTCDVPLSSVQPNFEEVGYRAAELLHRQLRGLPLPEGPVRIRPVGLEVRRSTEVTASHDVLVAKALAIIRHYASSGMSVKELATHLPLSRRSLERRFKKVLGRTLHDEIRARRLERARTLLLESDRPVIEVAQAVGYADRRRFARDFQTAFGDTPSAYRKTGRVRT